MDFGPLSGEFPRDIASVDPSENVTRFDDVTRCDKVLFQPSIKWCRDVAPYDRMQFTLACNTVANRPRQNEHDDRDYGRNPMAVLFHSIRRDAVEKPRNPSPFGAYLEPQSRGDRLFRGMKKAFRCIVRLRFADNQDRPAVILKFIRKRRGHDGSGACVLAELAMGHQRMAVLRVAGRPVSGL